jgi:hypothetical protein
MSKKEVDVIRVLISLGIDLNKYLEKVVVNEKVS